MRQENAWRVVSLRRAGESGSPVKSLATFVSLLSQFAAAAPTGNYKPLSVIFTEYGGSSAWRRSEVHSIDLERIVRFLAGPWMHPQVHQEAKDPLLHLRVAI